jgi:hypothetical protein
MLTYARFKHFGLLYSTVGAKPGAASKFYMQLEPHKYIYSFSVEGGGGWILGFFGFSLTSDFVLAK